MPRVQGKTRAFLNTLPNGVSTYSYGTFSITALSAQWSFIYRLSIFLEARSAVTRVWHLALKSGPASNSGNVLQLLLAMPRLLECNSMILLTRLGICGILTGHIFLAANNAVA